MLRHFPNIGSMDYGGLLGWILEYFGLRYAPSILGAHDMHTHELTNICV